MVSLQRILNPFLMVCYFLLVGSGLMVPSTGSHSALNPKGLSFILLSFALAVFFFFRNRFTLYQYKLVGFILLFTTYLMLFFFIGFAGGIEGFVPAFDQFKLFLITGVVTVSTLYVVSEKLISRAQLLLALIRLNCCYSIIKLSVVILHLVGVIDLFELLKMFGFRFMSMHIIEGLSRLQTSVDIITPFLMYYALQNNTLGIKISRRFRGFYLIISLLSVLLSFSRFFIGVAFIAFFFHWTTLAAQKLMRAFILAFILIFGGVTMMGLENIQEAFYMRFLSEANSDSDKTRVEQTEELMEKYEENELIGTGLGGSADAYLRDSTLTYSYEVQWVSFLMQFGVLGVVALILPLIYIASRIISLPITREKIGLFCMFGLWVISGFTNPFLISLTSGIVYSTFILAGDCLLASHRAIPLKNT